LTENENAEKIERDLAAIVPKKRWVIFPHWLIFHGRRVCNARKPKCSECTLADICPSRQDQHPDPAASPNGERS
jgi:endonuclease-3